MMTSSEEVAAAANLSLPKMEAFPTMVLEVGAYSELGKVAKNATCDRFCVWLALQHVVEALSSAVKREKYMGNVYYTPWKVVRLSSKIAMILAPLFRSSDYLSSK
eukprot:SAG31_NODE_10880_length_1088_cov_1.015167_1_plen_105_part_00